MKMTKEEFRERLLRDLARRKKYRDFIEDDIDFYFRGKITKYIRRKMNQKY